VLLPYASSLIEIEDEAIAEMKHHVAVKAGRLRISYLATWDGLPTSIVSTFRLRHPEATVDTMSGYSMSNLDRIMKREADFAFFTVGTPVHDEIAVRSIDRKELVVLMAPTHPLTALDPIPVRKLRGVPMIAVSAGVNDPVIAACTNWLARHLDEDPNFVAHEPPDQLAEAVAIREDAVTLISKPRASAASYLGLVFRQLAPSPVLECGIAYRKDNRSAALAHLLEIIDELAVPAPADPTAFENLSA